MKKIPGIILYFMVAILVNSGCQKKHDKKKECRIERLTKDGSQTYDFTYGDDGKLSAILSLPANEHTLFSYDGKRTIVTVNKNGNFQYRMIIDYNAFGLADNVLYEDDPSGTYWFNQAFTYDGNKVTNNTLSDVAEDTATTSYIWENGDPSVMISDGDIFHYKYYTNKNYQPGDWRYIQQLITGYWIYKYDHLFQSSEVNGYITYYTYQFDEAGRITAATATSPTTTTTYTIEYACDQ